MSTNFLILISGTLSGLLSTGFFYDKYNEHLLLGFTMLFMGVTVGVAPFCHSLPLVNSVLVVNGFMQGSAVVGMYIAHLQ